MLVFLISCFLCVVSAQYSNEPGAFGQCTESFQTLLPEFQGVAPPTATVSIKTIPDSGSFGTLFINQFQNQGSDYFGSSFAHLHASSCSSSNNPFYLNDPTLSSSDPTASDSNDFWWYISMNNVTLSTGVYTSAPFVIDQTRANSVIVHAFSGTPLVCCNLLWNNNVATCDGSGFSTLPNAPANSNIQANVTIQNSVPITQGVLFVTHMATLPTNQPIAHLHQTSCSNGQGGPRYEFNTAAGQLSFQESNELWFRLDLPTPSRVLSGRQGFISSNLQQNAQSVVIHLPSTSLPDALTVRLYCCDLGWTPLPPKNSSAFPLWASITIGLVIFVILAMVSIFMFRKRFRRGQKELLEQKKQSPNDLGQISTFRTLSSFDSHKNIKEEEVELLIEPFFEPQINSSTFANSKITLFFNVDLFGECIALDVNSNENVSEVKRRLSLILNYSENEMDLLFAGNKLKAHEHLASVCREGTTIYVIRIIRAKEEEGNYSKKQPISFPPPSRSTVAHSKSAFSSATVSPNSSLEAALTQLSLRNSSDPEIRRKARNILATIGENNLIKQTIMKLMDQDLSPLFLSINTSSDEEWLPSLEEVSDKDLVYEAAKYQRTKNFILVGQVISEANSTPYQQGLVRPLNVGEDGKVEGVNSIVWQCVIQGKLCVLKGLLPFSNLNGYTDYLSSHEQEYLIPQSVPQHENIDRSLHTFTASSVLIYPFISQELRDLNDAVVENNGRRFIRKLTTYLVSEYYPSTLRKCIIEKYNGGVTLPERELLLITLQILKGVSHLGKYQISHRDIKDDNIFMTEEGRLVIADFGSALSCEGMFFQGSESLTSRIGNALGTAPEVSDAIKSGPPRDGTKILLWSILKKNDVYSVGVLMHKICKLPFPAELDDFSHRFSTSCLNLMKSMVHKDPTSRPSAEEAINDISSILWGSHLMSEPSWLYNKRLDLFYNITEGDSDNWLPENGSIERKQCLSYFRGYEEV